MSQTTHTLTPDMHTADWLARGAILLSVVASTMGIFGNGLYRDSEALLQVTRANDVLALLVAFLAIALMMWRGAIQTVTGRLTLLGGLMCLAYVYSNAALGLAINALTLVHVAITALAFWAILLMLRDMDAETTRQSLEGRIWWRLSAAFLFFMAGITLLHWGGEVVGIVSSGSPSESLATFGWVTNPLITVELVFVVPLCLITGYRLFQRKTSGVVLGVALLVLFALLDLGLLLTPFVAAAGGQPFDVGLFVFGAVFFAFPALLLVPVYRRL